MTNPHLSIRLDLANGDRIGPGKIALLEAIRAKGSISEAARHLGMSYRRAWMLVDQINETLREPAVSARQGGQRGGWTVLTPTGERVIELYHAIEELTCTSARQEFRAIAKLVRQSERARLVAIRVELASVLDTLPDESRMQSRGKVAQRGEPLSTQTRARQ